MNALQQLKTEVLAKQKILAKIYAQTGTQSLFNYVQGWQVQSPSENAQIFFNQAQKLLFRVYLKDLVSEGLGQANKSPLVSTIDHHGILNHPFFVNSNLIYSQRTNLKYLLCLSAASISLNNSSWPGCLLVTGQDGLMKRFPFFPDKIKTQAVLACKSFTPIDVNRVEFKIKMESSLSEDSKRGLLELTQEIFQDQKLFEFDNFSKQAAYVSSVLWEKIFPKMPKLLYLPLEDLVSELLINEIIPRKDHVLYKLFFTPKGWSCVEKYFSGSLGAFSGSHKGSFLFWGVSANSRRVHLHRLGSKIMDHGLINIELSAQSVAEALLSNILYPTSLVCFLVLLYYGITCMGGFNQVNWLTEIKEKFVGLLNEWEEGALAFRVSGVPTENFSEGTLAFAVNTRGEIYKPTALDLFLQNDTRLFEKYRRLASIITVQESIDAQLPEIYKVITPFELRDSRLLAVTEADILNQNGLISKIKLTLAG